jgi:hydroxyacylglutathione hydrolase
MYFEQCYLEELGHASYVIGSEDSGEALVLDPQRDVRGYFDSARRRGLRIRYGVDTHGHNDYLSGLTQLERIGAVELLVSDAYDVGFGHRRLRDGEQFEMGEVGFEVVHTPGHTPEHIALLVYDRRASADLPVLVLSGGSLLVGDVGRPDLVGEDHDAAQAARTMRQAVERRILSLPDHVQVFPTHVAGSLCGGRIGQRLSTTVGYERRTNEVLAAWSSAGSEEGRFASGELPAVPPYWRRMRARNVAGVEPLGALQEPPALRPEEFMRAVSGGAVVLDVRSPAAFAAGHVPGSLNVPAGPAFPAWAGTVVPEGSAILLVLESPLSLSEVVWSLLRIGYDRAVGWLSGGMAAWHASGATAATLRQMTVHELRDRFTSDDVHVLDVRQPAERAAGHIEGSTFVTGADVPALIGEVGDRADPLAVVCGSGYRSSVVASLLAREGWEDVRAVIGGMAAWHAAGYAVAGGA